MADPSVLVEREAKLEVGLHFSVPNFGDGPGRPVGAESTEQAPGGERTEQNGTAASGAAGVDTVKLPDGRLTATYLDTVDFRLLRRGITLRHRTEAFEGTAPAHLWTLKLPKDADGVALVRAELSWPGRFGPVPAEVSTLVTAVIRRSPLVAVAKLVTVRRRMQVTDVETTQTVEVDDDVVSVMDGRRLAARFREVEVEGPAGSIFDLVLDRLQAAGAVTGDSRPKLVRALGPRAAEPVVRTPLTSTADPEAPTSPSMAEVIASSISAGVERMIRHDAGVRLGDEAEHVHQARVGTRRLRSDLGTFRDLLDAAWVERVRDGLGWVAAALGGVRDADVLAERLEAHAATLEPADRRAASALLRKLLAQRDAARNELLEVLASERYVSLLDDLVAGAVSPPLLAPSLQSSDPADSATATTATGTVSKGTVATADESGADGDRRADAVARIDPSPGVERDRAVEPDRAVERDRAVEPDRAVETDRAVNPAPVSAEQIMAALATKPWKRLRRAVNDLGDSPEDDALHDVRIKAKRVRYAAEAAIVVSGKPARRFALAAAGLQSVLGDFHDACVAEEWLRQASSGSSAAQALVAGQLIAVERQIQLDCRKSWRKSWRVLDDRHLRAWLRR